MGCWRGATFKEYVRENLSNYAEGMSRDMKKIHGFVNIDAGAYKDVSYLCMSYFVSMHKDDTSLYSSASMLTKPWIFFIALDIPST